MSVSKIDLSGLVLLLLLALAVCSCLTCNAQQDAHDRYRACVEKTGDLFRCNQEFPVWP